MNMFKLLLLVVNLTSLESSIWAAGTPLVSAVIFNNRVGQLVDAPVSRPDGTGAGAGAQAQLAVVNGDGTLLPLFPATTFRTSSAAAAYYVNSVDVRVPGVQGQTVTLRMRAWVGASFETANMRGESSDFGVILGNPTLPPINLAGLRGFTIDGAIGGGGGGVGTGGTNEMTMGAPATAQGNKFTWDVTGVAAQQVVLEMSLDVQNWFPVMTNQVLDGLSAFTVEINLPRGYFRTRTGF